MMNIRSAQQMMKDQTLEYVFPFSGFQFETDVNFVVTTEGRQSAFFKVTISMRIPFGYCIHDGESRRTSTFPLDLRSQRV